MKNNAMKWILAVVFLLVAWVIFSKMNHKESSKGEMKSIYPVIGNIRNSVSTTGTVLPKNRLEVKPPVNGRIEEVLVKEGDRVKAGQTIAIMSSTDRAALLDAARGQGTEALANWQEVYKPIPLIAPIEGEIIVGTTQPGQTVTTADAVIVISDRLIVRAQVDETDIGKVEEGKQSVISLDAYPDSRINAVVDHIYYESRTVNNVTVYEVDLLPDNVPAFFRSGMNASVEFIKEGRENVLTLPVNAVQREKDEAFVLLRPARGKPVRTSVKLGLSDDKNVEIVSGLSEKDEVLVKSRKYTPPQAGGGGTNPLAPQRRR